MNKMSLSISNSRVKILIGVLYLLILSLIAHWVLLALFKISSYKEVGVWNQILYKEINANVIFVGSSRTSQHFNTTWMNKNGPYKTFNLGLDGSLFDLQYERLKLYLENNDKPSKIYIGVDIESFQRKNGVWNEWSFVHLLNKEGLYKILKEYDNDFLLRRYLPLYSFAKMDKIVFLSTISNIFFETGNYNNGFIPVNAMNNNELLENSLIPTHFKIDEYYINSLENLVNLSLSVTNQVTLVYTPEHISAQNAVKNRSEIFTIYRNISDEFSIEFIDYSKSTISSKSKYFYNSQHLNSEGANYFTKIFFKNFLNEDI